MKNKNYKKVFLFVLLILCTAVIGYGCKKSDGQEPVSPDTETKQEDQEQITEENQTEGEESNQDNIKEENQENDTKGEDSELPIEDQKAENDQEGEENQNSLENKPKKVDIYTIDEQTLATTAVTAVIPSDQEITAQTIVDAVVLALDEQSIPVKIASVKEKEKGILVDLTAEDSSNPFGEDRGAIEGAVLDCLAHSLLDNVEGCEEVYFTVNGKEYETGHFYLPLDEPYAVKSE